VVVVRTATVLLLILLCAATLLVADTETVRLTDDGRSVVGAFSPCGSMIAYIKLDKRFTGEGLTYFKQELRIWEDGTSRLLAALPDIEPERDVGEYATYQPVGRLHWLTSGDYILLPELDETLLVRVSDGATSTITEYDPLTFAAGWQLSPADVGVMGRPFASYHGDGVVGEPTPLEPLPDCVALESAEWTYDGFVRSPTDFNTAAYIASCKHFRGCACTEQLQHRYLGIVDMTTGARRRLTFGTHHTIDWLISWTPDGRRLLYLSQAYSEARTALTSSNLHVVGFDSFGDRHLCSEVTDFHWASDAVVVADIQALAFRGNPISRPQQLSAVDTATGVVQRLTSGRFYHEFRHAHGDRYLVVEHPVGGSYVQGDLCIIRPL